jgi:hypothetical protein
MDAEMLGRAQETPNARVCLLVAWLEEGERQTDLNPKGIYDRFPCREGWDFIRWSISKTQKSQNERTEKRGRDGLCSAEAVIYISKCLNW